MDRSAIRKVVIDRRLGGRQNLDRYRFSLHVAYFRGRIQRTFHKLSGIVKSGLQGVGLWVCVHLINSLDDIFFHRSERPDLGYTVPGVRRAVCTAEGLVA